MNKREQKRKINSLLNLLFDPAVLVDENGRFIAVNVAFEEITGLKQNQIIGKFFFELSNIPEESKAILLENFKRRIQGVKVAPYEVCITDGSGSTRFVEVKGKLILIGEKLVVLVVLHEVTQRRENEQRLKEYATKMERLVEEKVKEIKDSEEAFRAICTCAKDAIIVVNQQGKVVYWNPAAEHIFGYKQEEAIGKNVLKLIFPYQHYQNHPLFAELSKNGPLIKGKIVEIIARRKDGQEFPLEFSAASFFFREEICLLGIMRDISERKRIERQMQEAEKRYRTLFNEAPLGI
ncbi:MAG: PAS domain S-box protein, partial [Candidatus Bathyarchaeia archaeon]